MATFDESPTVCQGQPWAHWAERIGFRNDEDVVREDDDILEKQEGDTMKLRKEDMSLFGFCPARDDFYLVVCEICRQVVKPQALKSHIELRHGGITPPKSEKMERQNKMVSSSHDVPSTQLSPSKQQKSGPPFAPSPKHATGSSSSTSSNKSHSRHESKSKRNHSLAPVVRVERISPNMMIKKSTSGLVNNMKMMGVNSNLLPVDKRDLPSPQQPPPGLTAVAQSPQVVSKKGNLIAGGEPRPKSGGSTSKSKVPKERKLLLCKDRVYDPNKHCGVWISEIGKQCTRSLTCKTHSLALRRSVLGRKKNFDELLADHRAAKEALLKATQASKEAMLGNLSSSSAHVTNSGASKPVANKLGHPSSISNKPMPSPVKLKSPSKGTSASPFRSSHTSGGNLGTKDSQHSNDAADRADDKSNSSVKNKRAESTLYVSHHPRPAAMCTFGSRQMGLGIYVFNRNLDHVRAVLRTSFSDRNAHPPPSKKLCVESKLPPVPDFSDPSDPYNFSWVEQTAQCATMPSSHSANSAVIGNSSESSTCTIPPSAAASTPASALKNSQTKSSKVKPITSRLSKDLSPSILSRAQTNSVKRKRTNLNNQSTTAVSLASGNVVVSADVGLITTTLPVGQLHRNTTMAIAKSSPVSVVDANKIPIRNNSKVPPTLGTVQAIKNHHSYPSNTNNAFRDLNIVVTNLDVANGQLPANSGTAVLSRSIGGFHTFAPGTLPLNAGISIANTTVTAVQQHLERNTNKKNKNASGKGAKTNVNQDNRTSNVINPYLVGGVLVEGLHNAVSLPATVVNNVSVGNNIISSQSQITSSTASPLFRTDSMSPQISTLSPLANGLGPSPPPAPPSSLHNKIVNHLLQGAPTAAISPGRLAGMSSPGMELASSNVQNKVKNATSRQNTCSPKGASVSSCKSSSTASPIHHLSATAQLSSNRAASVPTRTTKSTTMAVSGITFQQVLGTTQLGQIQLPLKSGTIRTLPTGTSPPLTMRTQLPLNILTTAVPTVAAGAPSPGQPQSRPSFLLQTDDLRHPEVQGSPSLHT